MPIYEFKCNKCKNQFEVLTMGMNEKTNGVCPQCKPKKVSKIMSSFGFGKCSSSSESESKTGSGCA
jgi:putative FmdB family regulatory protein